MIEPEDDLEQSERLPEEIDAPVPRSQKARDAARRSMELQDLRDILGLAAGRRFFMRMIIKTRLMEISYTGEALSGAYNEGMRSVGQFLRDEFLEADRNNVMLAEIEHYRREEEQDNARRK